MCRLGQFVPGNSVIHRLDPRIKIILTMAVSMAVLGADVVSAALASAFVLTVIWLSGLRPRFILASLRPVRVFIVLLVLAHLLVAQGAPGVGFSPGHKEGLRQGMLVAWRFGLLVMAGSILAATTSPSGLAAGLERLLAPARLVGVPSQEVAVMMSLAFRFVPALLEEVDNIKEAQMARGRDLETGNAIKKVGVLVGLAVPLLVNSSRRVEQLAEAMEARAYQGELRTSMRELHITFADWVATAVTGVLVAGLYLLG